MVSYIDAHRDRFGVESICRVLPIAPSTYHRHRQQQADPTRRSARAQRDDTLRVEIQRVYDEQHQVYGLRKVWKQWRREGIRVVAVEPGLIATEIHESAPAGRLERLGPTVPIGRVAPAEEVAGPVLFLLSDAASYITGTVLRVAGGR